METKILLNFLWLSLYLIAIWVTLYCVEREAREAGTPKRSLKEILRLLCKN